MSDIVDQSSDDSRSQTSTIFRLKSRLKRGEEWRLSEDWVKTERQHWLTRVIRVTPMTPMTSMTPMATSHQYRDIFYFLWDKNTFYKTIWTFILCVCLLVYAFVCYNMQISFNRWQRECLPMAWSVGSIRNHPTLKMQNISTLLLKRYEKPTEIQKK